ncbi:TetR/AcrR family transcriptional regulator [Rhodococcus sp. NPDC003348]
MTSTEDRRKLIADAALDIVASDGIRALTHRAVDRRLDLSLGSTSYYFRTKRELLYATVGHLHEISRREFARFLATRTATLPDLPVLASDIAAAIDHMLATRARDLRARYALTLEMVHDKEIQIALTSSIFSKTLAAGMVAELGSSRPEVDSANFIALLEGFVLDRVVGAGAFIGPRPGTPESVSVLTAGILTFLRGLDRGVDTDPSTAAERNPEPQR